MFLARLEDQSAGGLDKVKAIKYETLQTAIQNKTDGRGLLSKKAAKNLKSGYSSRNDGCAKLAFV